MDEKATSQTTPAERATWGKRPKTDEEKEFLRGAHPRFYELFFVFRVLRELLMGIRRLHFQGACVTVFGSARFDEKHPFYAQTRTLGGELAKAGFTVLTGGGPGLMEAANRGAKDVGGHSVGCNIQLPNEQKPNPYVDTWVEFRYFFIRKLMLAKYSYAFVAVPGGFGTLDELLEILVLIQTQKMKPFPVILFGIEYWRPLMDLIRNVLIPAGTISPADADLIVCTNSAAEATALISDRAMHQFGLTYGPRAKPRWYLFEKN